ncbi:hypothetical protein BDV95DRAFT_505379 [Massariosphaeria phaeospora]|uniref:Guanine nucleotide exchange factor Vps9 n=1 Tax=Massariosphaeria phaeospora TaxID=100035 RepID=A0A7C8M396_9PLEO|nr:hypothetical protein BDV95DRAFT_505379 [Massariosphaeria phaeospora]
MSPPNAAAHLDDVQDTPRSDTLENGAGLLGALEIPPGVLATEGVASSPDGRPSGNKSHEAGQAAQPRDEAGQLARVEQQKKRESQTERPEEQIDKAPRAHGEQEHTSSSQHKQNQPLAEPLDEITSRTANVDLSSTPPPASSSNAAGKVPVRSPSPPPPPPKDEKYLSTSDVPSRAASPISPGKPSGREDLEDDAAAAYTSGHEAGAETGDASGTEIQSIMEQFERGNEGPDADEIMSPRLEFAAPALESPVSHPPRRSSLVPVDKPLPVPGEGEGAAAEQPLQTPPRTASLYRVGTNTSLNEPMSPSAHASQYKPQPPIPDPEPDLPFDFHRFLEQLRHRTADPVAKFLRSFLLEFGKKQWMVHEQVKIVGDFLEFISKKMAQCEVWRTVSDAEFDNAREGMEKLVMNRLYSQTFSPAIPPPEPASKSRRRQEQISLGRRGQHQEDVERDEVLAQKVRIYKWIKEEHLDIKPVSDKGRKFLHLAQQELLKIKSYRAPRDKVICVLNCCKVIFGFLRTSSSDQSADAFVPLLIYTVLQANPDHLVSNVQYILRFRNQDKLGGEAGYYISSLMGAIQFVEGLDKTSLTVTDEEFEKNVEAAVSAIAERHAEESSAAQEASSAAPQLAVQSNPPITPGHRRMPSPHNLHLSEKSAISRPEVTQRNSLEAEQAGPRRSTSLRNGQNVVEPEEDNAAVAGLLRTIQRPLSTIGRIFSDNDTTTTSSSQPATTPRLTPQPPARRSSDYSRNAPSAQLNEKQPRRSGDEDRHRQRLSAEDAAARQASAEAEEARRIQRQEHNVVVETLQGMFPQLDRDVIDDVVRQKQGRVGLAVDACLALSNS